MVDLAGARVVAILTRAPSAGGKSRLFAALGRPPDPTLLTALLLDTIDAVAVTGVTRLVAVEPPAACDEVRALVPGIEVVAQSAGTLGERMAAVMNTVLRRGARAVAIVGSDIPDLPPHVVIEAFSTLERDPEAVVIGPATDGGYYLVAATTVPPVLEGIDWGTDQVLSQTVGRATERGVSIQLLSEWRDVDEVADLARVESPRTRAWVQARL
jgi:rSAM/selenodomain-associated transferase 1